MRNLIFFDTETTGINEQDRLCQLAYKMDGKIFCELYKPPLRIPPEASAVTHISNKMVADKKAFTESDEYEKIKNLFEDDKNIVVAHNAKFDVAMLAKEGINPKKIICTLRVARALDKENKIPQHKLQYLRYYLEIEIEAQAHDALGDVLVMEKLFDRLLDAVKKEHKCDDEKALEIMMEISARPSMMHAFSFGKYSGKTVAEVAELDRGYLEWFLRQKEESDPDNEDWIHTLKYHLGML